MEQVLQIIVNAGGVLSAEGKWDVPGNLDLSSLGLTELPPMGKVGEDFYCGHNQLTSLEGAPQTVGGGFYCSHNQLTSLEGTPQEVGRSFYCHNNQLTSLKGAPQTVGASTATIITSPH